MLCFISVCRQMFPLPNVFVNVNHSVSVWLHNVPFNMSVILYHFQMAQHKQEIRYMTSILFINCFSNTKLLIAPDSMNDWQVCGNWCKAHPAIWPSFILRTKVTETGVMCLERNSKKNNATINISKVTDIWRKSGGNHTNAFKMLVLSVNEF